jgi:hypothetical protein
VASPPAVEGVDVNAVVGAMVCTCLCSPAGSAYLTVRRFVPGCSRVSMMLRGVCRLGTQERRRPSASNHRVLLTWRRAARQGHGI